MGGDVGGGCTLLNFGGQANPNSARTAEGTTAACDPVVAQPTMADPKPMTFHDAPESSAKPYPPCTESSNPLAGPMRKKTYLGLIWDTCEDAMTHFPTPGPF